jgi:hypothetical protein
MGVVEGVTKIAVVMMIAKTVMKENGGRGLDEANSDDFYSSDNGYRKGGNSEGE